MLNRRQAIRLGAVTAAAAAGGALAGCGSGGGSGGTGGSGGLVFLSDQLSQTTEAQAMRTQVLSGFPGSAAGQSAGQDKSVDFIAFTDTTQFITQVVAQSKAGAAIVDLIGGLQGDFVSLQSQVPLRDMSDVVAQLSSRHFPQQYLELAKIDGAYRFVPWITASYVMVASKKALAYLPAGASTSTLTYGQLLAWGQAIHKATGRQLLGFPASPDGLMKRFLQGYLYPSFTGGLNTTFDAPAAVTAWQWMKEAWSVTNPQSPTYAFMQEPLLAGEVWVAWDHAVRLIDALKNQPGQFVAFPAPLVLQQHSVIPEAACVMRFTGVGLAAASPA